MHSQFRILGPIEVDAPGGRRVPRGRPLSLLALLLVYRGAIVSTDQVVDELWEGAGPRHARKAVQVVVSRLRSALGEGVVRLRGRRVLAAARRRASLDADRFEELFRRGRAELAGGDPLEAAATLRQALELWRGPALADAGESRFAQPEIARLEELRLACLSDRLDADLAIGRHAEVAGELEALVQRHPLRERLRGQQMLALYHAGRQADALDAYRSAYAALADGLGIEPSPELRALEAAILQQSVPAPADPRPAPPDDLAVDARRLVTCVFAQLEPPDLDPESLRTVVERYHDMARAICARFGGVAAEWRSDAVLVVFGTPVAREDDVQRALRAAAELVGEAERLPFGVRARCGVCTGEVVAAPGSVVGAPVGAAERLARAASGREVRMDESTWRLVRHAARAFEVPGGFLLVSIDAEAPAIQRRLDRPLIGRADEVAQLRAAFDARHAHARARVAGDRRRSRHRQVAPRRRARDDRRPAADRPLPGVRRGHDVLAAARDRAAGDGGGLDRRARVRARARTVGRAPGRGGDGARGGPGRGGHGLGLPAADRRARPRGAADRGDRRRPPGRAARCWTCSSTSPHGSATRGC